MTRPSKFKYECIYKDLVGTKYENKCPDLRINGINCSLYEACDKGPIKNNQDISEIWIKDGAEITLLYKKLEE